MNISRGMAIGYALIASVGLMSFPGLSFASDQMTAKEILQQNCVQCHRLEGKADSRFNLKAPDLIWAGSKYKRPWLISWLTGKEAPLYAKRYRWDLAEVPFKHPVVKESEANAIADYFAEHNKDPRVKVGAFDLSKVTKFEADFGAMAFKAHACLGCHTINEDGKVIGGPQSTALHASGQRYDQDWLFRFGLNPQDFVPHSGEFLADATEPQLRAVIGYLMTQGVNDFKYYEPWTSPEFGMASVSRGKVLYKEYCSQCHGATGKGDGPAASGLDPKPAIHANIPFEKLPMEYLYNVINHGGPAIGKSPNMPYWGLTIGQQGVADVIAYLKATFKGVPDGVKAAPTSGMPAKAAVIAAPVAVAAAATETSSGGGQSDACVQLRKTAKAPDSFLAMTNPLAASAEVIQAGKTLFQKSAKPAACAMCHGEKGDGKGIMGAALVPPPRNFTCNVMMKNIPDGQLFWIIKNGSSGTGMMSFAGLSDDKVWQLIQYIRSLAR
ncbi:MAG: Cytochrome c [Candidatus Nitrotoga sp. SPKER]|nr:MAG: Cytochrome c [Candidatus Nitrotoga sp. SPKER]